MKKTIYALAISMIMAGTIFTGCKSSAKKVEDAQDKVEAANQELTQARKDSILQFTQESEAKIAAHAKSIADFKARIATEKKENRATYEKKLAAIEQQDSDLKKKLDDYKATGKDNWETFKADFTKSMEAINDALKDLTATKSK